MKGQRIMKINEFYDFIGGDFKDMISRINNETLVLRFVKKFVDDQSFFDLKKALEEKDLKKAFVAVHTLKGLALNLSYTSLAEVSSKLTEYLRNSDTKVIEVEKAFNMFKDIESVYNKIVLATHDMVN